MKKSPPKLWKRILFGLIAFIFIMGVFLGAVLLKLNIQKNEAAQLTENDFVKKDVVIDSVYIKPIYQMPWPRYLRKVVFVETTFSIKDSPDLIYFRSPQYQPTGIGDSDLRNLKLKSGDSITITYKKKALEQAKNPNFLSKFYHRYKRPLVYNMANKGGTLYDVGMDYDKYIDEKFHGESFSWSILCFTIIIVVFVGFKFNLIK